MVESERQAAPLKVKREDYLPKPDKKEQKSVTFLRAFLLAGVDQKHVTVDEAREVFLERIHHLGDLFEDKEDITDRNKSVKLTLFSVATLTNEYIFETYGRTIPFIFHQPDRSRDDQFMVKKDIRKGSRVIIADGEAYYLINARLENQKDNVKVTAVDSRHPQRKEVLKNRDFKNMLRKGWISVPRAPKNSQKEIAINSAAENPNNIEIFSAENHKDPGIV